MRAANKRTARFAAALVGLMLLLGACGGGGEPPATATSPSPSVVSPVTGLVVEIESDEGFGEVTSFVVKAGDDTYEIFIAKDVDYGFPLSHLNAHRVGAEPVVVELELRDGRLFALSIEDA